MVLWLSGFGNFANNASVIVGAAKLVATMVTVLLVDKKGRRLMLFIGISMMLVALILLTAGLLSYC